MRYNPSAPFVRSGFLVSYRIRSAIKTTAPRTAPHFVYDTHLKFNDYISSITNRAYQRIGLIFRGFVSNNVNLLKRAYIVYVRPILEYCTCVWSPYLLEDIRKIESVQRYFTRRLFPKNSYSYNERLFLLNLESLESRRLKYDLKMYFKIMNNLTIINPNDFFSVW